MSMDTKKLFQVLVAGGALLATACLEEDEPPRADAGSGTDAPLASEDASTPADAEPTNCGLCPNPECCVTEADGTSHEHAGMMCCWGTSC